ncbi:hypothetical protein SERLA73DRAFT_157641 [Serpula lacrymans var. lacrymans S7.3]|uniref:Uncharacterized protein n=1 Tax=Serpula lacrymans var. lacrymans (strain S7.3) TaxID=936435 RepID=F8PFS2_SERL3|nr:hypothetical protein SERLA73DRAFT_157641 [Serpula lacrymans var. lacrymans S7.3]
MTKKCSTVSRISNLKGHANKKLKVDNFGDKGGGKENQRLLQKILHRPGHLLGRMGYHQCRVAHLSMTHTIAPLNLRGNTNAVPVVQTSQQAWSPKLQEVEDEDAPSLPPASPSPPKQHQPWALTVEEVDDEDALFKGEKGTNADSREESDDKNDGNDGIHDKHTKFKQSFTPPPTTSDAKAALADAT